MPSFFPIVRGVELVLLVRAVVALNVYLTQHPRLAVKPDLSLDQRPHSSLVAYAKLSSPLGLAGLQCRSNRPFARLLLLGALGRGVSEDAPVAFGFWVYIVLLTAHLVI